MEYKTVKEFFIKHMSHIEPTESLYKKLKEFRLDWSTKTEEYIEFLGSKYLGVHNIRFSSLDDEKLMTEVFNIKNWKELQKEVYKIKGIEENFKVVSNIIYLTLIYTVHLFLTKGSTKLAEKGAREACLILEYRMFTSLVSNYFKFNTSEAIAATVYNKLSHKYLIKKLDNWQKVFEYRVEVCLDKKDVTYKRLIRFTTDDVIFTLSNIQTKIREQVKHIYKVLIEVVENKDAIEREKSTFVGGEKNEEQLQDIKHDIYVNIEKTKRLAIDPGSFIRNNVIKLVDRLYTNTNEDLLREFLKCMVDDNFIAKTKLLDYINEILVISYTYLQRKGINPLKPEYMAKNIMLIRHFWSSSKVSDPKMKEIKEELLELAKKCTGKKTIWMLSSLVLAFILYIFILSIINNYED